MAEGKPQCIYLFLLNPEDEHETLIYFKDKERDLENDEIVDLVLDMVSNAKAGRIAPIGRHMHEVTCNRVSYAAFVADSDKYYMQDFRFNFGFHTFKRRHYVSHDTITGRIYLNSIEKKSGHWDGFRGEGFRIRVGFSPWRGYRGQPRGHNDSGTNLGPPLPPP